MSSKNCSCESIKISNYCGLKTAKIQQPPNSRSVVVKGFKESSVTFYDLDTNKCISSHNLYKGEYESRCNNESYYKKSKK